MMACLYSRWPPYELYSGGHFVKPTVSQKYLQRRFNEYHHSNHQQGSGVCLTYNLKKKQGLLFGDVHRFMSHDLESDHEEDFDPRQGFRQLGK